MPTFILKKYEEKKPQQTEPTETNDNQEGTGNPEDTSKQVVDKEMLVEVSGSVSEIVANALNKVFMHKNVTVEEQEDDGKNTVPEAEAISTEDIEEDPVRALRLAKSGNSVLIVTEGFKTKKEEYFLSNMEDYKGKVFYSVESFVNHIVSEFCNDSNS